MTKFFHYTSSKAVKAIKDGMKLAPSQPGGGDANYGPGVYFTKMEPDMGKSTILNTNYGIAGNLSKKAEWVVQVTFEDGDLPQKPQDCARDLYIYPVAVTLTAKNCEIYPFPGTK